MTNVVDFDSQKELLLERYRLQGSLLEFIRTFYYIRNNRTFDLPQPIGRENHVNIVLRELTKLFYLETKNLIINLPPGHFKSTLLSYFVAWSMTHYPDCHFVYISYSSDLAEGHTAEIKAIMQLPLYERLFGVSIDKNSQARGDFRTICNWSKAQGRVVARGSSASITGLNCGIPNAIDKDGNPRFSGLAIMDDLHKPDEVHSDLKRSSVIKNYNETIKMRRRGIHVGQVLLGQRLHEDDICQFILDGKDGLEWKHVVIKSLDDAENALAPNLISKASLLIERQVNEYAFWSQHQQQPQPSGGGIFKIDWFPLLYDIPDNIIETFVTVDCAESEKKYADYTVFSFWGLYKPKLNGAEIPNAWAIHWLDCYQARIEPKDIESELIDFWAQTLRFKVPPLKCCIEKKSMGTMLCSTMKNMPSIRVIDIERNASSGSKTDRFLECQRSVASGYVTLPRDGKHTQLVLEHMRKITANNTHRHDDIADTMADAVKIALIDKTLVNMLGTNSNYDGLAAEYARKMQQQLNTKRSLYGSK
jgi:predicted phage terminase large subunit-like protein